MVGLLPVPHAIVVTTSLLMIANKKYQNLGCIICCITIFFSILLSGYHAGIEYNYFSADNLWNGKLMFLQSFSPERAKKGTVFASHISYQSTRWNALLQQEYISGNYSAEVGYVPRTDYFKLQGDLGHLFYTEGETPLLSHGPRLGRVYFFDTNLVEKDQINTFSYRFNFKNRSQFSVGMNNQFITLLSDFDPLRTQVALLEGGTTHRWTSWELTYNSKPQNRFTYSLEALTGGYYEKGKRSAFFGEFSYRFQPFLELNSIVNYNYIKLRSPWNTNPFWLLGMKANLTLTNTLFFSNLFQYNEQLNLWNFNSRLQWRYKPASDIFNEGRVLNIILVFIGGKVIGSVCEVSISLNAPVFLCL